MGSGVDDIDFVKSHRVHDLFSLLDLALGTVNETRLGAHCVVVGCSGKAATGLGDLARSLVDCDDISSDDLLFLDGFDHFLAEIVDSLHLGSLESDLSSLCARG